MDRQLSQTRRSLKDRTHGRFLEKTVPLCYGVETHEESGTP